MYLVETRGGCTWYAPGVHMVRSLGVPGSTPGITVAKIQNLSEGELVPNYSQRFCKVDPFY